MGGEAWVVAVIRAVDVQFLRGGHMGGSTARSGGQCSRVRDRDRGYDCLSPYMQAFLLKQLLSQKKKGGWWLHVSFVEGKVLVSFNLDKLR